MEQQRSKTLGYRSRWARLLLLGLPIVFVVALAWDSIGFQLNYPPTSGYNRSYDTRLSWLRRQKFLYGGDDVTLLIGGSIAANNIDGVLLEDLLDDGSKVITISIWGLGTKDLPQFLAWASKTFKLRRVIFVDTPYSLTLKPYTLKLEKVDISADLDQPLYRVILRSLTSTSFFKRRELRREHNRLHSSASLYTYLGYDHAGSTLLAINTKLDQVDQLDPVLLKGSNNRPPRWAAKWSKKSDYVACNSCGRYLDAVCKQAKRTGAAVWVVAYPAAPKTLALRPWLRDVYSEREASQRRTTMNCGARYWPVRHATTLADRHFADWIHLNRDGARAVTRRLAPAIRRPE